ncbi:MAG TPA: acetate--CoA ligase family protein [Candidatus Krumholzibacteria bacterium]|nr:acetate--CoA ligase family protein [Candidatus Krumholzibacteria bacterium]
MHALDAIFKPRSIAVIGATPRPGSIGRQILVNLFVYEFNGKIFPVNPKYEYIHSTKAYASVEDIPDAVDLAVIVVPAPAVLEAVEQCAKKGVKGLVIITAGFKETGPEGAKREQAIVDIVRKHGMRLVGPNCMGVLDATPDVRMNATFSPGNPPAGGISFMSQSGALGVAILLATEKLKLGFAYFASVGNKADVSGNDLLEFWENDPHTNIITMYLESFGNPRKFTELATRISKKKPIVIVKSGTSAAGARAASSHTGSLAGTEAAADALLRQVGVLRVSSIEEMIHLLQGLTGTSMPKGNRLCLVTNAGGPAIMAADAADGHGLIMATLQDETKKAMRALLPAEASVENPVDMIAGAGPDQYEGILALALDDPNVDMVITIFVPPLIVEPLEVMRRITRVARAGGKPVLSVLMAEESYYERIPREIPDTVPFYRYPEDAVKVAEHMNRHRLWRERPAGTTPVFKADAAKARALVDAKQSAGGGYLSPSDTNALLDAYGFPIVKQAVVPLNGDLAAAAKAVSFPVVLKVVGEKIVHKSDVGGVIVGIRTSEALEQARATMEASLKAAGVLKDASGFMVQEMVTEPAGNSESRQEVILGVAHDPKFGPLVMFGMGGRYVEILRDVVFRVLPMTDLDAREMVRSIRAFPLLEGVRGEKRVDIEFIEELILRLAQLVRDVDGIAELDFNPVIVSSNRSHCRVVDARVRVAPE